MLRDKTILIISPEPWGINFLSKHHYALTLAKWGNKVYFLNPSTRDLSESIRIKKSGHEGLYLVDYRSPMKGTYRLPGPLRRMLVGREIKKIHQGLDQDIDVVWSFDPHRLQQIQDFEASLNIYHPVDLHFTPLEKEIASQASCILATSDSILERFSDHPFTAKSGHGLDEIFLGKEVVDEGSDGTIRVGYVGNLSNKLIDVPTIEKMVKEHPDVVFEFVGPYQPSNLSQHGSKLYEVLEGMENVQFHGPMKKLEIVGFFRRMDILLLAYTTDNPGILANPHKMLEYLSSGKVVLCHYIDEYKESDLIVMAKQGNHEMPELMAQIIGNLAAYNSEVERERRKTFASSFSYESVITNLEKLLIDHG